MTDERSCSHRCSWPDIEAYIRGVSFDVTMHIGCFHAAGT
jgi:hypothetical protein